MALVAIGAVPASELAHGLVPIAADGGVATDVAGRTDRERIFACGDVASAWRPWSGDCRSIGHWTTAAGNAQAVAAAILGTRPPPAQLPYSWSDSFGLRLQQIGGPPPPGAELTLDASPDGFEASYRSTASCSAPSSETARSALRASGASSARRGSATSTRLWIMSWRRVGISLAAC